ncbi:hypothetical protein F5Y16DRAFT_177720 [Xylariaceae sp. FL0255]|nr:hypothetical protein F5Y16DRAFT_177720 [Xylariaceae sp. FL0255]
MAISMDIVAAPTKEPPVRLNSQPFDAAVSALRLALQCRRVLSRILWPSFLQAYLLLSIFFNAAKIATIFFSFVTHRTLCALGRYAIWTTRMVWDSKSVRRLRRKIEFEFFTMILGAGGNNLCLVIFWPGWIVLAFAGLFVSTWCAG